MNTGTVAGRLAFVGRLASVAIGACLALGPWTDSVAGGVRVLSPQERHFGKSYSELAGDFWNWAVQFPFASSPLTENGAVDCSRGQKGIVWFLAGNFGGTSHRTCSIPRGKALFFPLTASINWAPEDGATVEEVRQKSRAQVNPVSVLELRIDGVAIRDLFAYRAQSPPGGFALRFGPLLADFGFGSDPDPRKPAVADGHWILLSALRKGTHEIHVRASDQANFNLDVTYVIKVGKDDGD